jgi:predicted nucleic acid-binding protein
VTLTDAGPLIAIIDADESDHQRGVDVLRHLPRPLVTTWPAFTEAMYLLSRAGGGAGRRALWQLVLTGRLELADLPRPGVERAATLMDKYADRPMDLADATLVALAEIRDERRIFTLDHDFHIYRIHGRRRFEILPR